MKQAIRYSNLSYIRIPHKRGGRVRVWKLRKPTHRLSAIMRLRTKGLVSFLSSIIVGIFPVNRSKRASVKRGFFAFKKWYKKRTPTFLEVRYGNFSIKLSWMAIVLIGVIGFTIWPRSERVIAIDNPKKIILPAALTGLPESTLQPQASISQVEVPKPVQAPVRVSGVINCGDNVYKQFIYQHESGCNTARINSIGCAGIGQACPGSKLPCSLADFACQDVYFTAYAVSRYGGWPQAYNAWLSKGWW